MNRHLSEEDKQVANRHMRRCPISFIVREMQMKTTMNYHFIPIKMAKNQKHKKQQALARMQRKRNTLALLVVTQTSAATVENSVVSPQKIKNRTTRGTWVVKSVECPTLGFGSCHDLGVMRWSPPPGSVLRAESAWVSVSFSPTTSLSLYLE